MNFQKVKDRLSPQQVLEHYRKFSLTIMGMIQCQPVNYLKRFDK